MFERISAIVAGTAAPAIRTEELRPRIDAVSHASQFVDLIRKQLTASPATFVLPCPPGELHGLHVEWQAIFASTAIAYIRNSHQQLAVCLLLSGHHAASEDAEIVAVESMLAPGARSPWRLVFRQVRGHRGRPLLVLLGLAPHDPHLAPMVELAADCLATAFFASQAPACCRGSCNHDMANV
jgi:hypothetical protein